MNRPQPTSRRDLEARLVSRARADDDFRQRLKTDPRTVVAEETGITVPESIEIEVLEETAETAYIVIPANRVAISDEELAGLGAGCGDPPQADQPGMGIP